ncbi:hypothetical protein KW805_02145 [Candidatus Pacearchaeota archaeon]|nr:hypothetical protein [Candidatus Pacearchaeota archaeon]
MQIDLLKDIVASVAGKNAVGIVDLLHGKKNVNEFLIAKKLNLTINQTRNILYKLSDEGLVSFIRKKDSKKGGWYTYFWTLNSGKSLLKFREKLLKNIEDLKTQASTRKTKQFFYCPNCTIEYTEENALLHDYTCPECGEILQVKESTAEISGIEKEVTRLESILANINEEIGTINKKEDQARGRRFKAEAKKKEQERLARKKERARLKKKEENTNKKAKKPTKKKKSS